MNKDELEGLLQELDVELMNAFPGPERIHILVVGGACLLFTGVTDRPTRDVDVIITDLFGTGSACMAVNPNKDARKVWRIIGDIGKSHGLRGTDRWFLNDDCAPFLAELGDIPAAHVWKQCVKLVIMIPDDLSYILACKLIAARPDKDLGDIAALRKLLHVSTREQAQAVVDRFFPDRDLQDLYDLPNNLDRIFGPA